MPIVFSVVARGTTILAKYASCAGNFSEIIEQVLSKVPQEDTKLTFVHGQYFFHFISSNRIIYLCIADDDVERSRAFAFLNDIKERFQNTYGQRAQNALPFAMNSDFSIVLATQMKAYLEKNPSEQKVQRMQGEVEDLKSIMVRNIDSLAARGERLELLIDRSSNLEAGSVAFRNSGRKLSTTLCWKNAKITIILISVLMLLIFIIVTASCGGFSYSKCS